ISPREYAQLVHELATRRTLIQIGDGVRERAFDNANELEPRQQIEQAEVELYQLAELGEAQRGFEGFNVAMTRAVDIAANAYRKVGHIAGLSTGFRDLDHKLGGLFPSDLIVIAARPGMGKTSLATNITFNIAKRFKRGKDENGVEKT